MTELDKSEIEEDEICGVEFETKEGICHNPPKYDDDRCHIHSEYVLNAGQVEENNAKPGIQHGQRVENSEYYNRIPEVDQKFVDAVFVSFLNELQGAATPFWKKEILWEVAVDFHKRGFGTNDYIAEKGMTQKKTVAVDDGYGPIKEDEENTLHLTHDRLGRTNMKILKELGVLGKDDSDGADAGQTLIDLLSSEIDS